MKISQSLPLVALPLAVAGVLILTGRWAVGLAAAAVLLTAILLVRRRAKDV
jgi:hypothetical protein